MTTHRKGQSLVEFALIFPVVILLLVGGIIDFGFAFYNMITLQQIANDTAKWAAESLETNGKPGRSSAKIIEYANSRKPTWWNSSFGVQPETDISLTTGGTATRVILSYESPLFTPFYSTVTTGISGKPVIPLKTTALYKIPEAVFSR